MSDTPSYKLCALLTAIVLASGTALAADDEHYVVREYTIPLADIDEIEFHASVGSMEIMPIDASEVRIILEIESQDHGWFDRKRDVSGVEMESHVRGRRLVLEQTEDGTSTEWTIQMPALARTTIEMGVGDIDAEFGATELELDLGVGEAEIVLPAHSTGSIDISVGVGDVRLRGAEDVDNEHAFVSQEISGRGEGALAAHIEVGVGDATLDLE